MAGKASGKEEEADLPIQMDDSLPFSRMALQSLPFIILGVVVVGRHRLAHT